MITLFQPSIKRETEKAILIGVEIDTMCGLSSKDVWFPKSQVQIEDGEVLVSEWIFGAKESDLKASARGFIGMLTA